MSRLAIALLAVMLLAQPGLSAADAGSDSRPATSSFAPHPRTHNHVYGSPIQPAVVGHAKHSHYKHAPHKP
jgi:hypothetical protein